MISIIKLGTYNLNYNNIKNGRYKDFCQLNYFKGRIRFSWWVCMLWNWLWNLSFGQQRCRCSVNRLMDHCTCTTSDNICIPLFRILSSENPRLFLWQYHSLHRCYLQYDLYLRRFNQMLRSRSNNTNHILHGRYSLPLLQLRDHAEEHGQRPGQYSQAVEQE